MHCTRALSRCFGTITLSSELLLLLTALLSNPVVSQLKPPYVMRSSSSAGAASSSDAAGGQLGPLLFNELGSWPDQEVAGFVDLNADRRTDTLVWQALSGQLSVLLEPDAKQSARSASTTGSATANRGPSLEPLVKLEAGQMRSLRVLSSSDFNGDSRVDLLLLSSAQREVGPYTAYVVYGQPDALRKSFGAPLFLATFKQQPLLVDLNADLIADIYGELENGNRAVFFGGSQMVNVSKPYTGPKWSDYGHAAFGDIDGDTQPDLVVLCQDATDKSLQLQVLMRPLASSTAPSRLDLVDMGQAKLVPLPSAVNKAAADGTLVLGLFTLIDIAMTGNISLLMPACLDLNCRTGSKLYMYSFTQGQWQDVRLDLSLTGVVNAAIGSFWTLAATSSLSNASSGSEPGLLRGGLVGGSAGDVNLDGLPDLAVGLAYWEAGGSRSTPVFVLPGLLVQTGATPSGSAANVSLTAPSSSSVISFTAQLMADVRLRPDVSMVQQLAFFDQDEDGILDLFVVSQGPKGDPITQLFVQDSIGDSYFLKVMILNGRCASAQACSEGLLPYGLALPGLSAAYNTESAINGGRQRAVALVASQSCCAALQLPFALFGLGPFANYIEELTAAIPSQNQNARKRLSTFLVPKSQIVVNPYTHDEPNSWAVTLFLQPLYNMKVIYVAVTLLGSCLILIVVISVLQYLEVREDHSEKMQEAQRFHFDAM